jgi:hypothetical protein
MSQITVNTISGVPPYTIYVCDILQKNCIFATSGVTSVPTTINIPNEFEGYVTILVKIVDSNNCQFISTISCLTQTPTPSVTNTPTMTSSQTSTNTPTPSITQTSVTPTPTPSFTTTPSITPSYTMTPSPTSNSIFNYIWGALCFIEFESESTNIGTYMGNKGLGFLGFTNGTYPDSNQSTFETEMNSYMDYFINNLNIGVSIVPTNQNGPISGPIFYNQSAFTDSVVNATSASTFNTENFDSFGNPYRLYNFQTISITGLTGSGWYTWIIPTGLTAGMYQKYINLGFEDPNTFQTYEMNSSIYTNYFTYTGTNFINTVYRVYTTYPSLDFYLDNSSSTIYFKGNSLSE